MAVSSVLSLRPCVEDIRFTITKDHQALKWIPDISGSSGHLACWSQLFVEFGFEIRDRPGRKHMAADSLTHLATEQPDKSDLYDDIPTYNADKLFSMNDEEADIVVEPLTVQ